MFLKNKFSQEVQNLLKLASDGCLPHAVMIESPDIQENGMKAALSVAKALVCKASGDKPCNKCKICRKIDLGAHPDVQVIKLKKPYKSIRVDDIREMKLDSYLSPNESEYKVYIISDGNLLNEQAQNVFLKILEEPPSHVKFIILCQSRFSMLETIRSRVQVYSMGNDNKTASKDKIKALANKVILSSISGTDIDIIKETSGLVRDRELFKQVADETENIISEICISKASGKLSDIPEELTGVSLGKLFCIREGILEIKDLLKRNVNSQLLVCSLCMKMKV